jgi:lipid II:glycine glycyltransferase (peptidoglycan interpeptide bridge formation enzyme)
VAGSVFLKFGKTVIYAFNGRDKKYLPLRPNDFIQWESIHKACEEGYKIFDLGEVPEGMKGLADFKSKWGAEARQIYHFYYPDPGGINFNSHEKDSAITLRKQFWRKLPLKCTEYLGNKINSYL